MSATPVTKNWLEVLTAKMQAWIEHIPEGRVAPTLRKKEVYTNMTYVFVPLGWALDLGGKDVAEEFELHYETELVNHSVTNLADLFVGKTPKKIAEHLCNGITMRGGADYYVNTYVKMPSEMVFGKYESLPRKWKQVTETNLTYVDR